MRKTGWQKVGVIGVDAGLCWVGDPCYCVTPDADSHPAKSWPEFCEALDKHEQQDDVPEGVKQWNYQHGSPGLGVSVQTGYGDGEYPVYVQYEGGRVARVMVDFMQDEEDEENEDD